MMYRGTSAVLMVLFLGMGIARGQATDSDPMGPYLQEGRIQAGAQALEQELMLKPTDDNLRFSLGVMQFIGSVEKFCQSWYRYGFRLHGNVGNNIPFLRLPLDPNPDPEVFTHGNGRDVLSELQTGLLKSEATLARVNSETVAVQLKLGTALLDINGDGKAAPEERLWRLFSATMGGRGTQNPGIEAAATNFVIRLDAGDVQWLRAYCHLLSAFIDFYLAHDDTKLFEHTAHLFFTKPETPFPFLKAAAGGPRPSSGMRAAITDAIALFHLLNMELIEPARMQGALGHLQQTVQLSRKSWQLYMAETDNEREWIPNPKQMSMVGGAQVTDEMVKQWLALLDECDAVLKGDKLIPFWRGEEGLGVNINKVFTRPGPFDLVLWIQGTAAAPYLEKGALTRGDFWQAVMRSFNGRFVGYAIWFN